MENSRGVGAMIVGAVVGGLAGYLFFTDRGRALRRQLEPMLDDVTRELSSFRTTLRKAAGAANQGWQLLGEALDDGAPQAASRYPGTHQSSPF